MTPSFEIENAMVQWVWKMSDLNFFLCDDVIIEKAKRVQARLSVHLSLEFRTKFLLRMVGFIASSSAII